MKVDINYIPDKLEENAYLNVVKGHDCLDKLINILENESYKEKSINVYDKKNIFQLSCIHIFYIESDKDKLLVHTGKHIFQSKKRLYELESELPDYFYRISKSIILNLRKVSYYSPELNGLMKATMKNNEAVYISRKYLKELRIKIGR